MTSSINSMTGFGAARGEADWGSWTVEAKSVNGRGLDVRVNTPPGLDRLEATARKLASERFKRGNLQIAVRVDLSDAAGDITINTEILGQLLAALRNAADFEQPVTTDAVATLLSMKGVVETASQDVRNLADNKAAISALEAGLAGALDSLAEARAREGASLFDLFTNLITDFRLTCDGAEVAAQDQPTRLRERLETQLSEIGGGDKVEADRLAAEIALSVAKADVREELDRLVAHFSEAENLLSEGSPVGRKLDFLSQEIGREANTLCSKSASLELTNAGLALKALNDQFKEQAANVE
ncbi:MAG: YicC family protein [Hyphomonadaceae bacterium]|nr:YicC family protein [Hyphomonadaceae bacterium]